LLNIMPSYITAEKSKDFKKIFGVYKFTLITLQ